MAQYRINRRVGWASLTIPTLLALFTVFLSPLAANALGVFGRLSSVSYVFEPRPSVQDPEPGTSLEQLARLSFTVHDRDHSAWTLYYMGTARGDLAADGLSGMKNRIYRGHLQFKPSGRLQVQLGRVWAN